MPTPFPDTRPEDNRAEFDAQLSAIAFSDGTKWIYSQRYIQFILDSLWETRPKLWRVYLSGQDHINGNWERAALKFTKKHCKDYSLAESSTLKE
jgi:hypothetical protein